VKWNKYVKRNNVKIWLRSHESGWWRGPFFIFNIFMQSVWPRFWQVSTLRIIFLRYSVTRHRFVCIVICDAHAVVLLILDRGEDVTFWAVRVHVLDIRLHCQRLYALLRVRRIFVRSSFPRRSGPSGRVRTRRGKGLF